MNLSAITLEHLEIDLEKNVQKVYIKDDKDRICFIVSLIDIDQTEERWEGNKYLVKVQEVKENNELFDLSRQFFKEEEKDSANSRMEKMVRDYQILTKTIEEEINPSLIFNDTVNYREATPECCLNCAFCVIHQFQNMENNCLSTVYLCNNKKNLRMNEYAFEILGKYAKDSVITNIQDMVEINPLYVCDNYGKK